MKLLALTLALSTGCSFVMTSAPEPLPRPPACNDSYAPPLYDLVGLFLGGPTLGAIMWGISDDLSNDQQDIAVGATIGLSMLTFAASAVLGFSRVSRCKDAHEAYAGQRMYAPTPVYGPPGVN